MLKTHNKFEFTEKDYDLNDFRNKVYLLIYRYNAISQSDKQMSITPSLKFTFIISYFVFLISSPSIVTSLLTHRPDPFWLFFERA